MIRHKKPFGIYHWDTFDNETILIDQAKTLEEAETKVQKRYGERISAQGADKVDIVNLRGEIVKQFAVG